MIKWVFDLLAGLAPLLQGIAFKLLIALGVGVATFSGVSALLAGVQTQIASQFSGLSADLLAMAYLLRVDQAINLIFSALTARLTLTGMTSGGSVSRFKVS